jgi:hypothetical protein
MDKQELIRFLQEEADRALVDLFPQILTYLESNFVVGKETSIAMDLRNYPENVRVMILNTAVEKLEGLGYTARSYYDEDTNPCLGVS